MSSAVNSTQAAHGKLWGAKARDWANFQEGVVKPVYEAVLRAAGVKRGTIFLDVGCGSGMAAAMAGARGAVVSGLNAAAPMKSIGRSHIIDQEAIEGEVRVEYVGVGAFIFANLHGQRQHVAFRVIVEGQVIRRRIRG